MTLLAYGLGFLNPFTSREVPFCPLNLKATTLGPERVF